MLLLLVGLRAAPGPDTPNLIGISGVHMPAEATGGVFDALVGIGAGIGSFGCTLALY